MARNTSLPTVSAVDLFCGVGGLTHGLVRAGISVKAGIDLDPACKYPYESNNSAIFIERDVNEISADEIAPHLRSGDISLLAGCAPCQPFSTYGRGSNGKKRGSDWQLVSSFGRIVEEMQPDLVTMENVSQLAQHEVFEEFLASLKGYDIKWSVVDCPLLGVPQSRRRLVLIASRLGSLPEIAMPGRVRMRTVRQTIEKLPPIKAGEQHPSDPLHFSPRLSPINMQRIQASKPGGTWRDWEPALQAACHRKATGATYPSVYGRMEWDKASPTITTQCFGYGNGRFGHPEQDRAISLREAAMLQTFPRSYKFAKPGDPIRFNNLGRLIGNAVPVRLGEFIGELLMEHVKQIDVGQFGQLRLDLSDVESADNAG